MKNAIKPIALVSLTALSLTFAACSKQTAEDHLLAAEQYLAAENIDAAILELKNAIQVNPRSASARFELGKIYLAQKRFESAEKELNRAMDLGYSAAEVIPLLSRAYKETGASNALAELSHTSDSLSASENAQIGYYKLVALFDLNQKEKATQLVYELQNLDTQSVYKGLSKAYLPILSEDYESALEALKALRVQSPLNEDVLRLLAKLHLILGQREEATEVLARLYGMRPDNVEIQFTYLAALMDLQRHEEAEPIVDNLLAIAPDNGIVNQFKGTILAEKENYTQALEHLKKAIANGRDNEVVRLIAGFSAYRTENYEEAVQQLSLLVDVLPGEHPALRVLADSQLKLGQNQDASDTLLGLKDRTEEDAALFSRAGFQLIQEGDVNVAKKIVEQGSDISDTTQELLRLGVLQLSLNDASGMLKLEQAVEKSPESNLSQQTLASAYLLAGENEKAAALAVSWKKNQPKAFEPYLLSGELAQRNKEFDKAQQEFEKAEQLAPDEAAPKLALANLLLVKGKTQQAIDAFRSVLASFPSSKPGLTMYYTALVSTGDVSDAMERAQSALEKDQTNDDLRLLYARMQFQQKQYQDVLTTLSSVDENGALPVVYWLIKGQALLRTNALSEATLHYEKWLNNAPFSKDAALGVLLTKDLNNDYESALFVADSYVENRPDVQVDVLRAYFNALLGRKADSRRILSNLPESIKSVPFVRGVYANLALQDRRFSDALNDAKIAYEAQQSIRNLLIYIRALDGTGQADNAFTLVSNYVKAYPTDQRAKIILAERLIGRDRVAATREYEELVKLMPDNFLALNNLAYLYFDEKQYEKALPLAQKAVTLRPSSVEASDTLAQIYVAQNKLKLARDLYEKAFVNTVRSDEVVLHFIELLVKMNDMDLATRRYEDRQWTSQEFKNKANQALQGV
jgi:putative PEP-CTERM system TPR-repeat lipoprotein